MAERFFVEQPIESDRAELNGTELHHLVNVLRARIGDSVILFDGRGAEFRAEIAKIERSRVQLIVGERLDISRELPFHLVLAVSLPKGDRQKWLVEKLTELGVTRLIPLVTKRSVAEAGAGAMERLRRAALEATKQCGRNRLLEIAAPQALSELLTSSVCPASRWIAHPGITNPRSAFSVPRNDALIAIGPEGGFTDDEVAQGWQAGWQAFDLGPRILRVETAAIAAAALVANQLEGASVGRS